MNQKTRIGIITLLLAALCLSTLGAQVTTPEDAAKLLTPAEINAALAQITQSSDNARIIRGILYHNLAQDGERDNADAVEKGLEELDDNLARDYPLAGAYRGSLLTLQASVAESRGNLFGAAALLDRGFKAMDRAMRAEPDNFLMRCLRGVNSIEVSQSSPFNRYKQAEEDLAWMKTHQPAGLRPDDRAMIFWMEGEIAYHNRDLDAALDAWEQAVETAPQSIYGKRSDDRLWDLEE